MRPNGPVESFSYVSLVELHLIPAEERAKFVLERLSLVMLALVADVSTHLVHRGLADRKHALPALPEELRISNPTRTQPVVGTLLQLPHDVADRLCARLEEEQVNVVGLRIDLNGRAAELIQNASHVGVKIGTNMVVQHALAVLRGEDEVEVNFGEGLRHGMRRVVTPLQGAGTAGY